MTIETIDQWEKVARAAADRVCAAIGAMEFPGLTLTTIEPTGANGTNSLDEEFVSRLENREHLRDDFLADA